jgi:hypothetical protein
MPDRGGNPWYKPGDYNVICDRTGFKVKASECQLEWNGLLVRGRSWEQRHPQDQVRGRPDDQSVPIVRPPGTDVFVGTNEVEADSL